MAALEAEYGQTPLTLEEEEALLPSVKAVLGANPLKADIFALEQPILTEVTVDLLGKVVAGETSIADLLDDFFVFDLHRKLYTDIWEWAGTAAPRERTLGIDPTQIRPQLRAALGNFLYRWQEGGWDAREVGLTVHAEVARIHPFVDGNGRTSRLLGNAVYAAAQSDDGPLFQYNWDLDKRAYIDALRAYDRTRTVEQLLEVVTDIEVL